jgi:hypothetical protein
MALALADRVYETTTTAGTGTITLAGAVTGYQSFSVIGNGNTTYYTIVGQGTSEWEVGIGTYTLAGTTLSRDTVLSSSASGAKVSFSAGTKNVFCDYPSGKSVYQDASGNVYAPNLGATTPSSGAFTTLTASSNLGSTRINPRISSTASASSLTPDISAYDQYCYTALAAALTINAPTGTPLDGNKLLFRILDNGVSRTLTWNATYTVTTTINKTTYVGCVYNANNTRWDVVAVTTQA